ncbi:hypothetical protein EIN_327110 [Entamoeba invadens IP1]|uniref:Protein serine/threonine kinase n=1 Tax=Entamoeba invadens IP1 TaxID=370355 RepID=A0A0A1TXJ0_ENTIV|nr:hypothetical protein EIN_327110 [Entamoeba invadens IP1]ELP86064.1 hypothetical protein EIN_327110 [Entamoeba invadens IP1]|eukprot:XP_004185410.1 hypothetical protein EIN_327110 [Entamoeba invadens IP1]
MDNRLHSSFTHPHCPYKNNETFPLLVISEVKHLFIGKTEYPVYIDFKQKFSVDVTCDNNEVNQFKGNFGVVGREKLLQVEIPKCGELIERTATIKNNSAEFRVNCKNASVAFSNEVNGMVGLGQNNYMFTEISNIPLILYIISSDLYTQFLTYKSVQGTLLMSGNYLKTTKGTLYDSVYYYNVSFKGKKKNGGKDVTHMYFSNSQYFTCEDKALTCANKTYTVQCSQGFIMNQAGNCIHIENCKTIIGGICIELGGAFDYGNKEFTKCDNNCFLCVRDICFICGANSILINGSCQTKGIGGKTVNSHSTVSCEDGYFNMLNSCHMCHTRFENCELCNKKKCTKCVSGFSFNKIQQCVIQTSIQNILKTTPQCPLGYSVSENGKCTESISHCIHQSESTCLQCDSNYILSYGNCYQTVISNNESCGVSSSIGCIRCKKGYYTDKSNKCSPCNIKCTECTGNSEKCQSCIPGTVLSHGKCVTIFTLEGICTSFEANGQCTRCTDGYFTVNGTCQKCTHPCAICKNELVCEKCQNMYFMNEMNLCESVYNISNCSEVSDTSGVCSAPMGITKVDCAVPNVKQIVRSV